MKNRKLSQRLIAKVDRFNFCDSLHCDTGRDMHWDMGNAGRKLAWLSKAQKLTIGTSAGCGCRRCMSHYDFLPAEGTNKFIG